MSSSPSSHLAQLAKTPDNINTEYKLHFIAIRHTEGSQSSRLPNAHPMEITFKEHQDLWEKFEQNYSAAEIIAMHTPNLTKEKFDETHTFHCNRLNAETVLDFLVKKNPAQKYARVEYAMLEVIRRDLTKVCWELLRVFVTTFPLQPPVAFERRGLILYAREVVYWKFEYVNYEGNSAKW